MGRAGDRASRAERGFTLIELMIVVAIIATIAAIAVPNLLAARKSGNESGVISALRAIATAQDIFRTRDGEGDGIFDYAVSLAELHAANQLIDSALSSGERHGYRFEMHPFAPPENPARRQLLPSPLVPGKTGDRYFFIDESGVIRFNETGQTAGTPPALVGPPIGG